MRSRYIVKDRKTTPFGPFHVDEVVLQVIDPEGSAREQRRVSLERGDTAAVLVHDDINDEVLLVRQFRYSALANRQEGSDGWVLEIPAGIIDLYEESDSAARREVLEELGITLSRLEHISTFFVSPGGTSERIVLFYAVIGDQVDRGLAQPDEEEEIEIERVGVDDFLRRIRDNSIRDAKTLIAGCWLRDYIQSADYKSARGNARL